MRHYNPGITHMLLMHRQDRLKDSGNAEIL